jgi:hypothetical protein
MPGGGVGGMESRAVSGIFSEPYHVEQSNESGDFPRVHAAPVAVGSVKQFHVEWQGEHALENLGTVTFLEAGRQIGGSIRNPLPHPLHDCLLLYGNYAYRLGTIGAGEASDLSRGTQRSLKNVLQFAEAGDSVRWNAGDRNVARVFQTFMFFRAAGGEDFTGLTNDYQSKFDLSDQLALGQAILVGRIDGASANPLAIGGREGAPQPDRRTTFVRIIFPVQVKTLAGR